MTRDDTAKAGKDYVHFDDIIAFKASESFREIGITIEDDDNWEPDKDFEVLLCENDKQMKPLEGEDTITRVTIIDNDNPGTIGFAERNIICRPQDTELILEIERQDGSSGEVSVRVEVNTNSEALGGRAASRGVDWVDPRAPDDKIVFKHGEII